MKRFRYEPFHKELAKLRAHHDVGVRELGRLTNDEVSHSMIGAIERRQQKPTARTIEAISKALDIDPLEFPEYRADQIAQALNYGAAFDSSEALDEKFKDMVAMLLQVEPAVWGEDAFGSTTQRLEERADFIELLKQIRAAIRQGIGDYDGMEGFTEVGDKIAGAIPTLIDALIASERSEGEDD